MKISKFIAKLVLAFFVFSAVPVQGPIFAVGDQNNRIYPLPGLRSQAFSVGLLAISLVGSYISYVSEKSNEKTAAGICNIGTLAAISGIIVDHSGDREIINAFGGICVAVGILITLLKDKK